ncbi:hypothetical protein BH11ARM2_BH11ARM2_11380 [soil metagenome]
MLAIPYAFVGSDTRVHVTGLSDASSIPNAREPDLSRDGKWVVYWADGQQMSCLLQLRNLSTGKERTLRRANLRSPRFSPDGTTVCFTEYRDNKWTLCSISATGGAIRVMQKGKDTFMPVWQDDGSLYAQVDSKFVAMDGRGEIVRTYPVPVTSSADTAVEGPDGTLYYTSDAPSDFPKGKTDDPTISVAYRWTPTEGVSRVSPPKTSLGTIRVWNGMLIGAGATVNGSGIFSLSFDGKKFAYLGPGREPGV